MFRSNRSYETKEELNAAGKKLLLNLRDSKSYKFLEKSLNGFNTEVINRLFSETANDEKIIITKYRFNQQLINYVGEEIGRSANMTSESMGVNRKEEFVKIGNEQILPN